MGRAPDYLPCTAIGMEHQNDKILKRLGLWHTGCSWYFQILQKLGLSHTSLSLRCSWLSWLAIGSLCVFTAPPPQLLPFLPSIFNKVFQATFLFLLSLLQFVCFFRPKIKWYVSLHFIVSTLSHRLSYVSDVDQNRADYDGLCVQRHTFFLPAALSFWSIGISFGVHHVHVTSHVTITTHQGHIKLVLLTKTYPAAVVTCGRRHTYFYLPPTPTVMSSHQNAEHNTRTPDLRFLIVTIYF